MGDLMQNISTSYVGLTVGISPLVDSWFLMKSPVPILSILVAYLYFVLKGGPNFMKNRKPYSMQSLMILYNAYQVCFCMWLCSQVFYVEGAGISNIINNIVCLNVKDDSYAYELYSCIWWYFFSKIIDLLDTIFFVLRKKQNQVTFLHVYHHSTLCFFTWGYLKYAPGKQGMFIGFLNSFVHIVMYFYYMVAAMGPKYRKYIWWKKYMTWIQLAQFTIMLCYLALITYMDCKLHLSVTIFFSVNVMIFLYLFADFYRKSYFKKQQIASERKLSKSIANEILDVNQNAKKLL